MRTVYDVLAYISSTPYGPDHGTAVDASPAITLETIMQAQEIARTQYPHLLLTRKSVQSSSGTAVQLVVRHAGRRTGQPEGRVLTADDVGKHVTASRVLTRISAVEDEDHNVYTTRTADSRLLPTRALARVLAVHTSTVVLQDGITARADKDGNFVVHGTRHLPSVVFSNDPVYAVLD